MNFKRFIFISALLLTVVLPLGAQTMLFSLTNQVWRYNQSNIDLGTVWKDVNYDDSGWPSGLGVFEGKNGTVPASIAAVKHTTLLLTNIGRTNQTITYYFRTQFAFTNDPSTVYLVATNLVDDGAIFYLNGLEVQRLGMNSGPVAFTNLSGRVVADANFEGTNLTTSVSPLIQGTNVLAVEVHQASTVSVDITFGMSLSVHPAPPLQILMQPTNQVLLIHQPTTLTLVTTGAVSGVQWFKNGNIIPGANQPSLTLTNPVITDAGTYSIMVSNTVMTLFSTNFTLSFIEYVAITWSPPSLALLENDAYPSTLAPIVTGQTPLWLQWFKDGAPLPGQTGTNLELRPITFQSAGTYFLVVSNSFNVVTSQVATIAVVSNSTGPVAIDPTFVTPFNFQGNATIRVQADDSFFVLGEEIVLNRGEQSYRGVLHFFADGTFDDSFAPGASNSVRCILKLQNGQYLIGGNFTHLAATNLARLNTNGTIDTTWHPAIPSARVRSIVEQADGKIVIVGDFTSVGGVSRSYAARLNADGVLDSASYPNVSSALVTALFQFDDGRLIFGNSLGSNVLTDANGIVDTNWPSTAKYVAHFNSGGDDGCGDNYFFPTILNGSIRSILWSGEKLLLTGGFNTLGQLSGCSLTASEPFVTRLNADGSFDTNFLRAGRLLVNNPGVGVYSVSEQWDGKLLYTGSFGASYQIGYSNGAPVYQTVLPPLRLNPDGSLDHTFITPNNSSVVAVGLQSDGRIVAIGSTFNGVTRNGIFRLQGSGGLPLHGETLPDGQFVLKWPAAAQRFVPQSNTNLASTNWIDLPVAPSISGDEYRVTNAPSAVQKFYRLLRRR